MFTGIVECVGSIQDRFHESIQDKTSEILTLWIEVGADMSTGQNILKSEGEVKLGDSMAVNGVCLTVTALKSDAFQCQLAPETLKKTNLGLMNCCFVSQCAHQSIRAIIRGRYRQLGKKYGSWTTIWRPLCSSRKMHSFQLICST